VRISGFNRASAGKIEIAMRKKLTSGEGGLRKQAEAKTPKLERLSIGKKGLLKGAIGASELIEIIDVAAIQSMMDDFYALTRIGVAINDLNGRILVSTGWQDICTKFHRVHPETARHCIKSDAELSAGVENGAYKLYKCKNNMWDMVTPIMAGGRHLGNIFLGQFFFEKEVPDYQIFHAQAARYGFDPEAYIGALERVPRWSRKKVETAMTFYIQFASMVSTLSYSNIELTRTLTERKEAEGKLYRKQIVLEAEKRRAAERDLLLHQEKIRALTAELMLKEERDRKRVATELHDRIGQNLAISKIKLGMASKAVTTSELAESICEIRGVIDQTIDDTRSLLVELTPPTLYLSGLDDAFEEFFEHIRSKHGVDVRLISGRLAEPLDENQRVIVYSAVRELLMNVVKHARATRATVSVEKTGERLRIDVKDDGIGFDVSKGSREADPNGSGLCGLRGRLAVLSGTLKIVSKTGKGTRVRIDLPLSPKAAGRKAALS
jgi:signal transduction histidine kinase